MPDLFNIVIYEPSAGRRCSRMSAFFKARATKERVPLINARMNGRCVHASEQEVVFYELNFMIIKTDFFLMPQRASVFCNFYIRVDREALVSKRALDVGSVAFKAMSTKKTYSQVIVS
jgi:hypothetical protein